MTGRRALVDFDLDLDLGMGALTAIVAFDLDDTLAPSKSPLDVEMAVRLAELLERTNVAVISGGQFGQFRSQLISPLEQLGAGRLDRLHVMPACGTQYYRWEGSDRSTPGQDGSGWVRRYVETLDHSEKERAFAAIESSARVLGYWPEDPWGEALEDRESQVTFSALGQEAPIEAKSIWDPTGAKKRRLQTAVAPLLPDLEVRVGGSTSIDVTRRGRDKSFAIAKLLETTGYSLDDVVYFGDQLGEGGNDHPVAAMGVRCIPVTDWHDTYRLLGELL